MNIITYIKKIIINFWNLLTEDTNARYERERRVLNRNITLSYAKNEIDSKSIKEYKSLVKREEYEDEIRHDKEGFRAKDKRVREREVTKLNEYLTKKGKI